MSQLTLDRARSIELSIELNAEPQRCWNNALDVLLRKHGDAVYIEGWISRYGRVFEHGWVELDGSVLDTTPGLLFGEPATYFPGIRYQLRDVVRIISQREAVSPPFAWLAERPAEYLAAQAAATEHAGSTHCDHAIRGTV